MCNHYALDLDKAYAKMINANSSLSFKLADEDYSNFTFLGKWSNHYWSWKNNMNFKTLIIKYEDLIKYPHTSFLKILNLHVVYHPPREEISWGSSPFAPRRRPVNFFYIHYYFTHLNSPASSAGSWGCSQRSSSSSCCRIPNDSISLATNCSSGVCTLGSSGSCL